MSCLTCFKGSSHDYMTPKGTTETIHGIETYVAGLPAERQSPSTIILLTDVFGLNLVNNKILADHFASVTGCRVLVPDIVPGGGVPITTITAMEDFAYPTSHWYDILGHIRTMASAIRIAPYFLRILLEGQQASSTVLGYVRSLRADMPIGAKLGVAGYCWGAREATKLAKEPTNPGGEEPLLAALYIAHPSSLRLPDDLSDAIERFGVPFSLSAAEFDFCVSREEAIELEAVLRTRLGESNDGGNYYYQIRVYEGVQHGFACRANPTRAWENDCANAAALQATQFFRQWLT
ncbi:hypothetical protein HFD88_005727 [Aspergillus terreus]|nr:hypothetical protein HFD88_005727 [Aspergillus terreus]